MRFVDRSRRGPRDAASTAVSRVSDKRPRFTSTTSRPSSRVATIHSPTSLWPAFTVRCVKARDRPGSIQKAKVWRLSSIREANGGTTIFVGWEQSSSGSPRQAGRRSRCSISTAAIIAPFELLKSSSAVIPHSGTSELCLRRNEEQRCVQLTRSPSRWHRPRRRRDCRQARSATRS
jgi:hypothetical protein